MVNHLFLFFLFTRKFLSPHCNVYDILTAAGLSSAHGKPFCNLTPAVQSSMVNHSASPSRHQFHQTRYFLLSILLPHETFTFSPIFPQLFSPLLLFAFSLLVSNGGFSATFSPPLPLTWHAYFHFSFDTKILCLGPQSPHCNVHDNLLSFSLLYSQEFFMSSATISSLQYTW